MSILSVDTPEVHSPNEHPVATVEPGYVVPLVDCPGDFIIIVGRDSSRAGLEPRSRSKCRSW
jgi:hypothetical protein